MRQFLTRTLVTLAPLLISASAQAQTARHTFTNSAVNLVPAFGPAATYPSLIPVAGLTGVSYHVSVSINMTHTFPGDLDILLVAPNGRAVILFADVGASGDFANTRIELDDCAPRTMGNGNLSAGRYRPTNLNTTGASDTFPAPAPAGPYDSLLANFNGLSGTSINGNWSLYVNDDLGGLSGQIDGWSVTFYTQPTTTITQGLTPIGCTGPDFDGDGRTDVAIYREATGEWFIAQSGQSNLVTIVGWGAPSSTGAGDTQAPADYDGDGITDAAVYRQSTGVWFVRKSSSPTIMEVAFGAPSSLGLGDTPVPGDYDGDGQADIAIYRMNTGEWFLRPSSGAPVTSFPFGFPPTGDRPARR